eukprot:GHVR01006198.1.p1 GENE.GHVR01006198.1~~GHVR01006198.1.p1  ORF type:complete len:234 (-),score=48.18 GHVR01006198.1:204-905(-)
MSREQTSIDASYFFQMSDTCMTRRTVGEERVPTTVIMRAISLGILPMKGEVSMMEKKKENGEDTTKIKHINANDSLQYSYYDLNDRPVDVTLGDVTDDDIDKFWKSCATTLIDIEISIYYFYDYNNKQDKINIKEKLLNITEEELKKREDRVYFNEGYQKQSNPWNFNFFPKKSDVSESEPLRMSIGTKLLEDRSFNNRGDFLYYYRAVNLLNNRRNGDQEFKVIIKRDTSNK